MRESHWITKGRKDEIAKGEGLWRRFGQQIFVWAIRSGKGFHGSGRDKRGGALVVVGQRRK
jgi:hypothetical protein